MIGLAIHIAVVFLEWFAPKNSAILLLVKWQKHAGRQALLYNGVGLSIG